MAGSRNCDRLTCEPLRVLVAVVARRSPESQRAQTLPISLEFHDSTLLNIYRTGLSVRVLFDAYVHRWDVVHGRWKGTGWMQPVEITLDEGVVPELPAFPIDLGGGVVQLDDVLHNLGLVW